LTTEIRRITSGPKHHFFGYIGHVRTIPWNRSGRWIVALQTDFQDRMPQPGEAAEIVLLDTRNGYSARVVDRTRAWNPQQGTMLYWNPDAPETQFFFNDRDPKTHELFCVLFDLSKGKHGQRVAEYRFGDTPVANSGVAQHGGSFLAINYGRLARLRPVTGYPGAHDWTTGRKHPDDDGIFKIDVRTRKKRLLVSFRQLADLLRPTRPDVDTLELFINHTLWSRNDRRIFFFVRGDFDIRERRLDVPFVMNADGTGLQPLGQHIGGHPEWESGRQLIGLQDKQQILFDVERKEVSGTLGPPGLFPQPGGDVALSPDGKWFVNGHGDRGKNYYTILRRADNAWTRTEGVDQGGYIGGNLRIDPSPCWNRSGTEFLVPGIADDERKTRQLYLVMVKRRKG
jgi:hypothetical protein